MFKMRLTAKLSAFLERPDSILSRRLRYQFLAALTVDIITFSHGVGIGWLSPTLTKLLTIDTPLNFPVLIAEASWIGSLIGLGSMLGNVLFGFLLDRVGRKICIYMLALPHLSLWILIYFAQSVEFLYVARFLGGMTGGGSYVVLPIFISEIADTRIRGTLSAMMMLSVNFGVLTGYILATYLDYYVIPIMMIMLPLIYLGATIIFPDSPQHLLRKGKLMAADKSFKFYKNCGNTTSYSELQRFNQEFAELQAIILKGGTASPISYTDFVTKPALKAICTAFVIMFVNQFSGTFAFMNYMSHIFEVSGSLLDPNTSTIVVGAVQICGAYAATIFVDRCGRKPLMLLSTGGLCLSIGGFGVFTHCSTMQDLSDFNWVPLVLMMIIVFVANVGSIALTFVLLVEIFPAKIRSVAAATCMAILSGMVFGALKIFPIFMNAFGISITMWSCSLVCLLSFIYLWIFLPETKGKSMDVD